MKLLQIGHVGAGGSHSHFNSVTSGTCRSAGDRLPSSHCFLRPAKNQLNSLCLSTQHFIILTAAVVRRAIEDAEHPSRGIRLAFSIFSLKSNFIKVKRRKQSSAVPEMKRPGATSFEGKTCAWPVLVHRRPNLQQLSTGARKRRGVLREHRLNPRKKADL